MLNFCAIVEERSNVNRCRYEHNLENWLKLPEGVLIELQVHILSLFSCINVHFAFIITKDFGDKIFFLPIEQILR